MTAQEGQLPLRAAALSPSPEKEDAAIAMVKLLLEHGADILSMDEACRSCYLSLSDFDDERSRRRPSRNLTVMPADREYLGRSAQEFPHWTSVHVAAETGAAPLLKFLVANGADVNVRNAVRL